MKHLVLISCTKRKLKHPAPAESLYITPLFKLSLAYARSLRPDAIYILSARHGLVCLDQHLAPYEQTLKTMNQSGRAAWGQTVLRQLQQVSDPSSDHFTILASQAYAEPLLAALPNRSLPLTGRRQGQRLQFLKRNLSAHP